MFTDFLYIHQIIHSDLNILGTMLHTGDIDIDAVNVPTVWYNLHGMCSIKTNSSINYGWIGFDCFPY